MQKIIVVYKKPLLLTTQALVEHLATFPAQHCFGITAHVKTGQLPGDVLASGAFDLSIACGLSLWIPSFEDLDALAGSLEAIGRPDGIYSVVESTPREYASVDWPEGTRSPGVTLFALFRPPAGQSSERFLELWQEHTALSLRFHPLIKYYRNAVMRKLSGPGENWAGIVEERVASVGDLAPERFYMIPGAREEAVEHLGLFIDLPNGGMRCGLLEEYIIRKPCWLR